MNALQAVARILAMSVLAAGCVLLLLGISAVIALATLLLLVSLAGPTPQGMPNLAAPVAAIAGVSAAGHGLVALRERYRAGPRAPRPAMTAVVVAAAWLLVLAVLVVAEASLLFAVAYTVVSMDQSFPDPLMALVIVSAVVVNIAAIASAPPHIADNLLRRFAPKEESCDA